MPGSQDNKMHSEWINKQAIYLGYYGEVILQVYFLNWIGDWKYNLEIAPQKCNWKIIA